MSDLCQSQFWSKLTRLNTIVLEEASLQSRSLDGSSPVISVELQPLSTVESDETFSGEQTESRDDEPAAPDDDQLSVETFAPPELKRCLTMWEVLGYGIASTVGSGIYVVTGTVVQTTGSSLFLCFLIAAFAALLSALSYAEFAARVPLSGSAYTFAYVTLGELAAWFIGSNLTLEYSISGMLYHIIYYIIYFIYLLFFLKKSKCCCSWIF